MARVQFLSKQLNRDFYKSLLIDYMGWIKKSELVISKLNSQNHLFGWLRLENRLKKKLNNHNKNPIVN